MAIVAIEIGIIPCPKATAIHVIPEMRRSTQSFHFGRIKEIPPVEQDRVSQALADAVKIQFFELIPFGSNNDSVATLGNGVHVLRKADVLQD